MYIGWPTIRGNELGDRNWIRPITFTDVTAVSDVSLLNGSDGSAQTDGQKKTAFEKFADGETVDVSLLIVGSCTATHIDNLKTIAENRKDCVVFASPERSDVVGVNDSNTQTTNVISFYNAIGFIFICCF